MKKILIIILCCVLATAAVLAALMYIPITRSMDYSMQGYLVSADGEILEEFPLTITGENTHFIIGRRIGTISFYGLELPQLEQDSFVLYPQWDSQTLTGIYTSGHFTDSYHNADKTIVIGGYLYYIASTNSSDYELAMIDLAKGTYCMRANAVAKDAFIVGITDPAADPIAVVDALRNWNTIPDLQR